MVAQTSYRADAQAQGLELVTVTLAQTLTPKLKTRAILLKQSCSTELQSDDKNSTTFIASHNQTTETTRKARETHLSSSDHVPPSILVHPCKPCARHVYMRLHVLHTVSTPHIFSLFTEISTKVMNEEATANTPSARPGPPLFLDLAHER